MQFSLLLISFFIIALIYSSVGFGGGTSYLALMGVMAIAFEVMRPAALLCNIAVVSGGVYIFYKEGQLNLKKSWPFLVASIPLSFLGGYWPIKKSTFFITLGISLVAAAFLLWFQNAMMKRNGKGKGRSDNLLVNLGLGGATGFLSGLVGIGGGVFLAPLLHLFNWDEAKKISALASVFILANSISGLMGQLTRSTSLDWNFIWPLMLVVFVGGQIGSRLGARRLNSLYIKRITAVLIFIAGLNILKDHV